MKEIRTIKMVESVDIVFVADDGKEFRGENAERDCRAYERTRDKERVKKAFDRLESKVVNIPFLNWFGEYDFTIIKLTSRNDFIAMMDYLSVNMGYYDIDITEPAAYPYNMTVWANCDCCGEYSRNLEEEARQLAESL